MAEPKKPVNRRINVDKLLDKVATEDRRRGCRICDKPQDREIKKIIARWVERKAVGDAMPALSRLYNSVLSQYSDVSLSKVAAHVRDCLGIDKSTGKPFQKVIRDLRNLSPKPRRTEDERHD